MKAHRWQLLPGELRQFVAAHYGRIYPDFTLRAVSAPATLPVFCYHRVHRAAFRAHLEHLRENGYRTLTADQLFDQVRAPGARADRLLALTFDDGLDDLYTVAYPLLRELGLTAIAYVVPAWIGRPGFVTWPQLRELHESGVVDVQSHSLDHQAIFTSPQIEDFFSPRFAYYTNWDIPRRDGLDGTRPPPLGAPIYDSASRLADSPRYLPDEREETLCAGFVREHGGEAYFRGPRWRRELRVVVDNHRRQHGGAGHHEDAGEQRAAIAHELDVAAQRLEDWLPGKTVRHFAFPWNQAGRLATKLLLDRSYRTVAIGLAGTYQHDRINDDAIRIRRVSGDFVPALPGRGRQSFGRIMLGKLLRRIRSGHSY